MKFHPWSSLFPPHRRAPHPATASSRSASVTWRRLWEISRFQEVVVPGSLSHGQYGISWHIMAPRFCSIMMVSLLMFILMFIPSIDGECFFRIARCPHIMAYHGILGWWKSWGFPGFMKSVSIPASGAKDVAQTGHVPSLQQCSRHSTWNT